jgi:hypothetical protein
VGGPGEGQLSHLVGPGFLVFLGLAFGTRHDLLNSCYNLRVIKDGLGYCLRGKRGIIIFAQVNERSPEHLYLILKFLVLLLQHVDLNVCACVHLLSLFFR